MKWINNASRARIASIKHRNKSKVAKINIHENGKQAAIIICKQSEREDGKNAQNLNKNKKRKENRNEEKIKLSRKESEKFLKWKICWVLRNYKNWIVKLV